MHSSLRNTARLVAFALLVLVAACHDPYAHRYATHRPSDSDLVGEYHLVLSTSARDDPTSASESGAPFPARELRLARDGSFEAVEFPVWTGRTGRDDVFEVFRTFSGRWNVRSGGSVDRGGRLDPLWTLQLDSSAGPPLMARIGGDAAPYELIFGRGDPDGGDAAFYWRSDARGQLIDPRGPTALIQAGALWGLIALVVGVVLLAALALLVLAVFAVLASVAMVAVLLALGSAVAAVFLIAARTRARRDRSDRR